MDITEKGRHIVTGNPIVPGVTFIPPDIYGIVRDGVVKACVDCLIVFGRQVLLGKRKINPWPDWWTFRGRILPGESPEQACARNTKADLGLEIGSERFSFLDVLSLTFDRRQEPPQENGCHDITLFHIVHLTKEEMRITKARGEEYSATCWFFAEDIAENSPILPSFHPAIKRIIAVAQLKRIL